MFETFGVISEIYNLISSSLKWAGYMFSAIFNVFTLPSALSLYLPSVVASCVLIVVIVGGIKTIISLLPF